MTFGLPYCGSKSSIAKWVIDTLPVSETFIDLFAGGCAVTHAAMLSDKWERFIANDISGSSIIFRDAIKGDFNGLSTVLSRGEFFASDDMILRLLYSFGNDASSYLWGGYYEKAKVVASKMLSAPSMHERRTHYREFIKVMCEYVGDILKGEAELQNVSMLRNLQGIEGLCRLERLERLQGLERLERLQGLERLERLQGLERLERLQGLERLERLQVMMADYRNVNIPDNATVYADIPYRNVDKRPYGEFDYDAFDEWISTVDHPVYVSEYDAPKGCVCIAERERHDHLAAYTSAKRIERIFVQERFVNANQN